MKRVLALVCAALLLGACASASPPESAPVPTYQGQALNPPRPRPSFVLTDTGGKPFSFGTATAGRPTFLFFGFTHCPDVCPTTLANVRLALRQVPDELQKRAVVVFVTTDVKRDTGPVIADYLDNFDDGTSATWVGLYGTQAQVDAAQAAAHVMVARDGGATHDATVLLYGPDDHARVKYAQNNNQPDPMAHDLRLIAG